MIDDTELDNIEFSSVCCKCKHLVDVTLHKCKAFDASTIPNSIWIGENKHTKPVSGDHGIQFEPLAKAK